MANTCSFFPIDFVKSFDSFLIEDGTSARDFSSWWRENSARAKVSVSSTLSCMLSRRLYFSAARSSVGLLQPCHVAFEFVDRKQTYRWIPIAGEPLDATGGG